MHLFESHLFAFKWCEGCNYSILINVKHLKRHYIKQILIIQFGYLNEALQLSKITGKWYKHFKFLAKWKLDRTMPLSRRYGLQNMKMMLINLFKVDIDKFILKSSSCINKFKASKLISVNIFWPSSMFPRSSNRLTSIIFFVELVILNNFYFWNMCLKCVLTCQEIEEIVGKCPNTIIDPYRAV